jgi:hypothetical protein
MRLPDARLEEIRRLVALAEVGPSVPALAELLAEVDRLRRMERRVTQTVPYVVATLDIHTFVTRGGEWCEVHRGRASSSIRQLETLLDSPEESGCQG